ncbi:aminodeoxychorismate lyase [Paenibacillus wynnii]|uniref:4-amino-4-deoxychorismate lyase n=1 Tax=Paenibacillus wynnii TaxID=268407 RepID=A0A098MCY5_9BACL|nr:aminodeoxychorismate lyase [Paenibacillus wynnii]KGE19918.1 4-amino-4-deoxychorismate lyase [Paenibacillus wynnii]
MNYIGMNEGVIDAKEAVVSVLDHGLLYGMGLFETFRTYEGVPFLLNQHLDRMKAGCQQLGIPFNMDHEKLLDWIKRLMGKNGLKEAYIRYTVTAGEDILGLPAGDYTHPNHILYAKALPELREQLYTHGKELQLLDLPRNTPEGSIRFKSLHYMNNILAKRELSTYPSAARGADGLMLTPQGVVAEGIVSNLFFIKNDVLCTPDVSTGILPGITREMVIALAVQTGLQVEEGRYSWEQLKAADEIFLTNSIQEIVPVTLLCEKEVQHVVSGGRSGPVTTQLILLYRGRAGIFT